MDGSQHRFDSAVSVHDVAVNIGPGLTQAALARKVYGQLVDTSSVLDQRVEQAIVTLKNAAALELLRHDAVHVMAQAVHELYPGTQVTIGLAIEDGFYLDFARSESSWLGRSLLDRSSRLLRLLSSQVLLACRLLLSLSSRRAVFRSFLHGLNPHRNPDSTWFGYRAAHPLWPRPRRSPTFHEDDRLVTGSITPKAAI